MVKNNLFILYLIFFVIISITASSASNLANPVAPIPDARVGIGVSYHLGGYTITNQEIPSLLNRIHARISYSPFTYFNFGIDLGVTQMEVAADTLDTLVYEVFHGNYKFSFGVHIKVSSPFFKDIVGLVGIAQGTRFSSENKAGAMYGGYDGAGAAGFIVHIKNVGYFAAGAKLYVIQGENRSYCGDEDNFHNVNNLRGWAAFDYFPKIKAISKYIPYISLEVSVAPDAAFGEKAPIQEISFSIAVGSITKRLYGEISSIEWHP